MFNRSIAAILLMLSSAALGADFKINTKPFVWQQVEKKLMFHVFAERERYTTLDRTARVVIAAETKHAGHDLADLAVHWSLTSANGNTVASGRTNLSQGGVDLTFPVKQLQPGTHNFTGKLIKAGALLAEQSTLLRYEEEDVLPASGRVALRLPRGQPQQDQSWPVQAGVPFPKGVLWHADNVKVVDNHGNPVDAGVVVRSRWGNDPNASIRWLGVDFQPETAAADWPEPTEGGYSLMFGEDVKRPRPKQKLKVTETRTTINIDTGVTRLKIRRDRFNVIDQWSCDGVSYRAASRHGLYVVDHQGTTYRAANDRSVEVSIEERTDMRVVVRAAGWYVKDRAASPLKHDFRLPTDRLCRFITRIEAYAGKPQVRVMNTLILTFDTFNVRLTDAGMSLPVPGGASRATFGIEEQEPVASAVGRTGVRGVQHLHDAFAIESGNGTVKTEARRSAGWAIAQGNSAALALGLRDLWQRYPKEIEVLPDSLVLHVWPKHGRTHPHINDIAPANIHKLLFAHQGNELVMNAPWDYFIAGCMQYDDDSYGVYKPTGHALAAVTTSGMGVATTSDVMIQLGKPADADKLIDVAETFMTAPHAVADPKWTCDSLAVGYIHPYDPQTFPAMEELTSNLMRGYWDMQDWGEMYGMWIYRSWLHSNYKPDKGGWNIYRLYNGTHHHEAPIPWILYARSGDPFYLKQGMANIRQLTDVQMIHHEEPGYTHKEFHSHQKRLIGSTRHDDCLAPWGNDHGILGHLCAYNGAILAYYLTGDLRLREVVVDEWQNTLLADRNNPEYAKADRSNTVYPVNPRDNSTAVGEIIDLYQLTYDPRLLALLAPRMDIWLNRRGCMGIDWGQPMHNVMLFHGSTQANQQLLEGARALTAKVPYQSRIIRTIARPLHAARETLALASILNPDSDWAVQALSMDQYQYMFGYAWNRLTRKTYDMHSPAGEYTLYMPRVMYALANRSNNDVASVIGAGIPAPRNPSAPTRVIVREDRDQPFKIYVNGHITQENGFDVRVLTPDGSEVISGHVEPGYQAFSLTVPTDGRTGEYIISMGALQKDDILAPYTTLPEVYATTYTTGNNYHQRLFTRSSGKTPETVAFSPHQGPGTILSADKKNILANTESGEKMTVTVGPEGIWAWHRTCYLGATRGEKQPVILAVDPSRWFMPTDKALKVDLAK